MRIATNILQFQIGWFACVLGAAYGHATLGVLIALGLVAMHVALSPRAYVELSVVSCAAALGFALDTALVQLGLLHFPAGTAVAGTAPFWMVALWMNFATTLNVSLAWLKRRRGLAALLGAAAAPAAYWAGSAFGVLQMPSPIAAVLGVAAAYALALPVLLSVVNRFDDTGAGPARRQASTQ